MRSKPRGKLSTLFLFVALGASAAGCGDRFRPISSHDVAAGRPVDPRATFATLVAVAGDADYPIVTRDDARCMLQLRSKIDRNDANRVSVINLQCDPGGVHITASGYLVHADGTIHRRLDSELENLQSLLLARLGASVSGPPPQQAMPPAPPPGAPVAAAPGNLPSAWIEPSSDPGTWGRGNFTCLPLYLPAQDQALLALKLSTGENADVTLSLAYSPALCHSPQCKQPSGCPALGIGDPQHVSRLAGRLSKNEVSPQATLVYRGQPVATLDLSRHGSVAQAMMDIKR